MTWILEKPVLIIVLGSATAAILGFLWLQTGRRFVLGGLIAVILLTGVGLLVERTVKTDREQIEATLHQIAQAVEGNDLKSVLSHIHSTATQIRQTAVAEFPRYEFDRVKIKQNLKIEVTAASQPLEAVAEFNVVVYGRRGGLMKHRPVPRFVIVTFQKEDGAWRVIDYDHFDPREGFSNRR